MFDKLFSSFGRLVGSPGDLEGGPAVECDRRIWVRFPCQAQVNFLPAASLDSDRFSAQVMNISRGGIGLMVDRELKAGQFLSVELPAASDQDETCVLAYVLHTEPQPEGQWTVGCSFSAELNDADLAAFGARRLKPSPDDQRAWVRFACPVQASFQLVRGLESAQRPARVVDISPSGIGLQVNRPVDVGTLITLEMRGAETPAVMTILASVVRITAGRGGEWTLGCNFIRELTEDELQTLL